MVPSNDDNGYFMVASDGGVFAFGDAHFAGSCPGIGGCAGAAVAVMPDASGNGYWLVTSTGNVYTFGDAAYFGAPGHGTVTSAVATPDGMGYWILLADGQVFAYGDAANGGSPPAGAFSGLDAATAIFAHLGRGGLLGLVGPGVGLQLRRRAQRRGHVGDAPQRGPSSPPRAGSRLHRSLPIHPIVAMEANAIARGCVASVGVFAHVPGHGNEHLRRWRHYRPQHFASGPSATRQCRCKRRDCLYSSNLRVREDERPSQR